ncbi:MAG: Hsp20/alpha crystallin family protein, partial [Deltaproteobacteria bacterium]|nr:Hsp20/alpha crystallin family protein [Deltaproteobacteria bacterium]
PRVNVWEDGDNIFLALERPGLAKEDVKIHVENGRLTISGENKFERDEKKETFHLVERRYGRFERSFNLGDQVDVEKIAAKMDKGILTVTLGKKEISKPKQIEVEVH